MIPASHSSVRHPAVSVRAAGAVCLPAPCPAKLARSISANYASSCTSTSTSSSYVINNASLRSSRGTIVACSSASSDTVLQPPTSSSAATSKGTPTGSVWELDFCSRPLLDERGKKVWELLICDPERSFEYAEYFPNSKINSAEVRQWTKRKHAVLTSSFPLLTQIAIMLPVYRLCSLREQLTECWPRLGQ